MRKWYSIGLLVIVLIMASAFLVACDEEEATTTTEAATETTEAATETTEAAGGDEGGMPAAPPEVDPTTIGFTVIDRGDNVLEIWDVPVPGVGPFPIHDAAEQDDEFALTVEVLDADGNVLGTLSTSMGQVDYSEYAADAAQITLTNIGGDVVFTYDIGM